MITNKSSSAAQSEAILVDVAPRETGEQDSASKRVDPNDKHLNTDHLLSDLKGRTISGTFITIAAQAIKFLLNLAFIMALARLLSPKDFGLYAMVTTMMGFLWIFQDIGLSTATVQRQEISHAQVSNLFWVNVGVGGVVTLVVAASAPAIAWFYREPRLIGITLALSITFLLTTSAVQHIALLNRQMRFGAIATIEVTCVLGGYLTGIGMALSGYGYWALVGANLMQVVIRLVLSWLISGWQPRLFSRNAQTRHLLSFGANITIGNLINTLARGLDNVLIGRFFGPVAVGLYSQSFHPSHAPAGTIHDANQCCADSGPVAGPNRTGAIPSHISSRVRGDGVGNLSFHWSTSSSCSSSDSCGPRAEMGTGNTYFRWFYHRGHLGSTDGSFNLAIPDSGARQRLAVR